MLQLLITISKIKLTEKLKYQTKSTAIKTFKFLRLPKVQDPFKLTYMKIHPGETTKPGILPCSSKLVFTDLLMILDGLVEVS